MNDIAQAVAAAQQLLASYHAALAEENDALAATPIDALAAWQGVAVERFNPEDEAPGTLGWLQPGEDLIWLSESLAEPVRRFTLAHELGHWVLHRRVGGQPSGALPIAPDQHAGCTAEDIEAYLDAGLGDDELLRPGQSYSPRARRERAADAFAAALLAPLDRVRALFVGAPQREPLRPEDMAAHFGMTLQALLGRLAELLRDEQAKEQKSLSAPRPAAVAERPASATRSYDPWQQAAIMAATPALVVAGPGSGKTSTLVGRVRYVVEEQGVSPQRLLALTFSNKAALEMRERIAALLGEAAGAALPTVSTFHSFCADLLRLYAPQVGLRPDFALLDLPGSYFLLRKIAKRLPLRHYGHLNNPELHFATLLGAISRAKDELATPEDYLRQAEMALAAAQSDEERLKAERAREVALVYRVYQEALAAQGDADFGDLIRLAVQFLKANPDALADLHERYQQILVDEFQDINRASGVLLKLLAGERATIWVVGDQDQAIYRFRGASPANIGQFHRDYPGAQVLPLSRNYRSLADIVLAAGAFREAALRLPEPTAPDATGEEQATSKAETTTAQPSGQAIASTSQEAVRQPPAEPIITLATASNAQAEVAGLVAAIEQRHARGVPYRDQVILCRTREHARLVIEGLERVGMPASAGGSLLEQPDVKDVLAIVSLLAEPSGMGLLRAAAQPDHVIPREDVLALFAHAQSQGIPAGFLLWQTERLPELSPQGFVGTLRLAEILADLQTTPDLWTLLARYAFIHTAQARRLLQATDRRSCLHLDHLRGLLDLARRFDTQEREREAEDQEVLVDPGKRWERFLEYLRVLIDLRADDGGRREAEDGEGEAADLLRVMTVHASKGLEFPVVYLPQLAQQRFPVTMRGEAAPMPPGLAEDDAIRSREDARAAHLLDEACLFYVGLTRARDELILSYAERYKTRKAAASDFLRHIEVALGSRLRRVRWGDGDLAALAGKTDDQTTVDGLLGKDQAARPSLLSASELEMYLRCPRQYQYRFVYGFQPTEEGYRQFYESVQRTVRVVHERLAAANAAPGQTSQAGENGAAPAEPFSLEAAQALFAENWRQYGPLEHPFADSYFAHGQRVIERTWSGLTGIDEQQTSETSPADEARPVAKLAVSSRLSQKLDVRLDDQTIQVTVDRVEDEGRLAAFDPDRPVRLVRHRMSGKDEEKADVEVRHVLYALAQEQRAPGRPFEVYEHNLSTGALAPVPLESRAANNRRADLAEALAGMRARRYPPKPDRHSCPRCPFLMVCPAE